MDLFLYILCIYNILEVFVGYISQYITLFYNTITLCLQLKHSVVITFGNDTFVWSRNIISFYSYFLRMAWLPKVFIRVYFSQCYVYKCRKSDSVQNHVECEDYVECAENPKLPIKLLHLTKYLHRIMQTSSTIFLNKYLLTVILYFFNNLKLFYYRLVLI